MGRESRLLLQIALDALTPREALELVGQTYPHFDIVEIGTPLIIAEGLSALEAIKAKFPDKKHVADLKIMDAGKLGAASAFKRGADIVTAFGAAVRSGFQLPINWICGFMTASPSFAAMREGMSRAPRRELFAEVPLGLSAISGSCGCGVCIREPFPC